MRNILNPLKREFKVVGRTARNNYSFNKSNSLLFQLKHYDVYYYYYYFAHIKIV